MRAGVDKKKLYPIVIQIIEIFKKNELSFFEAETVLEEARLQIQDCSIVTVSAIER